MDAMADFINKMLDRISKLTIEESQEDMRKAEGLTLKAFYGHDTPFDKPFKEGDKVRITRIVGGCPEEEFHLIRETQTVASCYPLPCSEPTWVVDVVDCPYLLTDKDVELVP